MLGRARPASTDLLVVGLGNPGEKYERTRHNVGADTVELLANRHGAKLKKGRDRALVAEVTMGDCRVVLSVPTTFMNESGEAVGSLARRYKMPLAQIVIIHDELDLPVGVLKAKQGGGLAGHNGLRSIVAHLHGDDFPRLRIGIGKPKSAAQGVDHVLKRFGKAERESIDEVIAAAAGAVEVIASSGIDVAMNQINCRIN